MMTNKAVRGLLSLLVGCLCVNLALLAKISIGTADRYHRSDAVQDFTVVNQRLMKVENNQKTIIDNQKVTMKKLGVMRLEPWATTQP